MEKSGIFSLMDISDEESKVFRDFIRNSCKSTAVDFVNYLIGDDYIQFLDLLAGTTLKIPSRNNLYRDLEYIKIYSYIKSRGFSVDSIRNSARIYEKNIGYVKRAIIKVSKTLQEDLPISLEELDNIKILIEGKNAGRNRDKDIENFKGDDLDE